MAGVVYKKNITSGRPYVDKAELADPGVLGVLKLLGTLV
jgi:hypothetical protein